MIDYALLGIGILVASASALVIGWALGQTLCRRVVRRDLWALYYQVAPDDTVPAQMKYDILHLIKRLEL